MNTAAPANSAVGRARNSASPQSER